MSKITKKNIKNTAAVFLEKIIKGCGVFLISVILARNLSVTEFGEIVYGQSLVQILSVICSFGLNGIIQKKLIQADYSDREIIFKNAFWLQIFLGLISLILGLVVILIGNFWNIEKIVVIILMGGMIFRAYETVKYKNEAEAKFLLNAYSEMIVYVIFIFSLYIAIFAEMSIYTVAVVLASENIIYLILHIIGIRKSKINFLIGVEVKKMVEIARDAWPFFLNSIFGIIYLRVDSLIIGNMLGTASIAKYMTSVRMVELSYIVPTIIMPVIFPIMIEKLRGSEKEFETFMTHIYRTSFFVGILIIAMYWLLGEIAIVIIFGQNYVVSQELLLLLAITVIPVFWGVANTYHLLLLNMRNVVYYRTLLGMITMIIFCISLIPNYGVYGACIARVLAFSVGTFSLLLFKNGREVIIATFKSLCRSVQ